MTFQKLFIEENVKILHFYEAYDLYWITTYDSIGFYISNMITPIIDSEVSIYYKINQIKSWGREYKLRECFGTVYKYDNIDVINESNIHHSLLRRTKFKNEFDYYNKSEYYDKEYNDVCFKWNEKYREHYTIVYGQQTN